MADVINTAVLNASAKTKTMTTMVLTTMMDVTAQFPPLKKGGRGDLLLLFARAKQKQIPPSIAARSPTPFFKGGNSNDRCRSGFSGSCP